jgi:hypothetical protein
MPYKETFLSLNDSQETFVSIMEFEALQGLWKPYKETFLSLNASQKFLCL